MTRRAGWMGTLLCMALLAAAVSGAKAQTVTGSIRGSITDQSGAVVPGAKVTAKEMSTGVVTTTTTDRSGAYNFQSLRIGMYVVSGSKAGFSITKNSPFSLEIDQVAKIDIKLQVGAVTATIDVAADSGSLLQTEDATLGTTITANTLESMPLSGQNFGSATLFTPGAVNPTYNAMGGANGTERDTSPTTIPSYNGNRQQTNNYIFDGTDINEPLNNVIGYNPAPESIGQMRVITGNANAEYGNVNGGEILMVTKQGTNKFHGSLYSYYENQSLTANLWSNNYSHLAKGFFHQNQFGATFGGPIYKNKLFFFMDFEGFRNSALSNSTASVATTRMRSGDFSELIGNTTLDPGTNAITSANYTQLFNTTAGNSTVVPYAGNIIPVLNPVAKYLFAHPEIYPLPNRQGVSNGSYIDDQNYAGTAQSAIVNNQGDVRVDYILGQHDDVSARASHGDAYDKTIKAVLPITFPAGDEYPYYGGVINEVHTFTNNLQNELRAGFSRVAWQQGEPVDTTGQFGTSGDAKLGWNLPNQPYQGFSLVSLPLSIESNLGTKAAATVYYDNVFDYGDTVTWLHGKHIIKGGAQVLRYQENNYYPSTNGNLGAFTYYGYYTANANASSTTYPGKHSGYGLADWVLDKSYSQGIAGVTGRFGQRQYRLALFGEDEWKVTPALTLNIGLRYGYDQPMYETNNKEANIDVRNPQNCPTTCILLAGKNGNSRALYNPFYKEFMPRVSFAYQLNPQMVLRGGYGITDDMEGTGANLRLTQNAPFLVQYSNTALQPTATTPGTPVAVSQGFTVGSVAGSSTRYQAWDPNLKPALIQQFNLTLQVLANNHTTMQLGYVGQLGQHLIVPENLNQYRTPGVASTAPFASLVGTGGLLYYTESEGYSNYHGLQAQIRQQLSHGLEYTFNYTFSKSLSNNPGFYGVSGVDGSSVFPQNIYNPHGDYGSTGFDTRNAVNFVATYALPFGHGRDYGANANRFVDWAIGGWKLSGDAVLYSGFPVTITSTNNANANASTARANQYRQLFVNHRTLTHWFGTDASATNCTGASNGTCAYGPEIANTFGTAHVGTERAPGYRVIDMSAFKDFRTYKEEYLEFRADAFNAFNIASYAAPNASVTSTSFGLITSTLSPARQFELALKYKF